MRQFSSRLRNAAVVLAATAALGGCENKFSPNLLVPVVEPGFAVTRLVADFPGLAAQTVDPLLINPFGIAFAPTGNLWVANNGSGVATVYSILGEKQALVVSIPTPTGALGGTPTGMAVNTTADFVMPNLSPAQFIFASEDGTISGWNPKLTNAVVLADRSSVGAVYKALAMASNDGANFLFATDFRNGRIDIFDDDFRFVKSFVDQNMPPGFAPFGIANISSRIFISFAKQAANGIDDVPGPGNGFIDVFNPDGTFATRFASRGVLNSPLAMVLSPSGFGSLGDQLIVGNAGDGKLVAYNFNTGAFNAFVKDGGQTAISIDGLHGLVVGPVAASPALFFSAGPNGGTHGLVGTITPR